MRSQVQGYMTEFSSPEPFVSHLGRENPRNAEDVPFIIGPFCF
jgi:hypothetical protein